jgi:hypothetical protein
MKRLPLLLPSLCDFCKRLGLGTEVNEGNKGAVDWRFSI